MHEKILCWILIKQNVKVNLPLLSKDIGCKPHALSEHIRLMKKDAVKNGIIFSDKKTAEDAVGKPSTVPKAPKARWALKTPDSKRHKIMTLELAPTIPRKVSGPPRDHEADKCKMRTLESDHNAAMTKREAAEAKRKADMAAMATEAKRNPARFSTPEPKPKPKPKPKRKYETYVEDDPKAAEQ